MNSANTQNGRGNGFPATTAPAPALSTNTGNTIINQQRTQNNRGNPLPATTAPAPSTNPANTNLQNRNTTSINPRTFTQQNNRTSNQFRGTQITPNQANNQQTAGVLYDASQQKSFFISSSTGENINTVTTDEQQKDNIVKVLKDISNESFLTAKLTRNKVSVSPAELLFSGFSLLGKTFSFLSGHVEHQTVSDTIYHPGHTYHSESVKFAEDAIKGLEDKLKHLSSSESDVKAFYEIKQEISNWETIIKIINIQNEIGHSHDYAAYNEIVNRIQDVVKYGKGLQEGMSFAMVMESLQFELTNYKRMYDAVYNYLSTNDSNFNYLSESEKKDMVYKKINDKYEEILGENASEQLRKMSAQDIKEKNDEIISSLKINEKKGFWKALDVTWSAVKNALSPPGDTPLAKVVNGAIAVSAGVVGGILTGGVGGPGCYVATTSLLKSAYNIFSGKKVEAQVGDKVIATKVPLRRLEKVQEAFKTVAVVCGAAATILTGGAAALIGCSAGAAIASVTTGYFASDRNKSKVQQRMNKYNSDQQGVSVQQGVSNQKRPFTDLENKPFSYQAQENGGGDLVDAFTKGVTINGVGLTGSKEELFYNAAKKDFDKRGYDGRLENIKTWEKIAQENLSNKNEKISIAAEALLNNINDNIIRNSNNIANDFDLYGRYYYLKQEIKNQIATQGQFDKIKDYDEAKSALNVPQASNNANPINQQQPPHQSYHQGQQVQGIDNQPSVNAPNGNLGAIDQVIQQRQLSSSANPMLRDAEDQQITNALLTSAQLTKKERNDNPVYKLIINRSVTVTLHKVVTQHFTFHQQDYFLNNGQQFRVKDHCFLHGEIFIITPELQSAIKKNLVFNSNGNRITTNNITPEEIPQSEFNNLRREFRDRQSNENLESLYGIDVQLPTQSSVSKNPDTFRWQIFNSNYTNTPSKAGENFDSSDQPYTRRHMSDLNNQDQNIQPEPEPLLKVIKGVYFTSVYLYSGLRSVCKSDFIAQLEQCINTSPSPAINVTLSFLNEQLRSVIYGFHDFVIISDLQAEIIFTKIKYIELLLNCTEFKNHPNIVKFKQNLILLKGTIKSITNVEKDKIERKVKERNNSVNNAIENNYLDTIESMKETHFISYYIPPQLTSQLESYGIITYVDCNDHPIYIVPNSRKEFLDKKNIMNIDYYLAGQREKINEARKRRASHLASSNIKQFTTQSYASNLTNSQANNHQPSKSDPQIISMYYSPPKQLTSKPNNFANSFQSQGSGYQEYQSQHSNLTNSRQFQASGYQPYNSPNNDFYNSNHQPSKSYGGFSMTPAEVLIKYNGKQPSNQANRFANKPPIRFSQQQPRDNVSRTINF